MSQLPVWEPSLSVGNVELDEQHARLLALAQQAGALAKRDDGADVRAQMLAVLGDIRDLARAHYAAEEQVLARNGCPDLVTHQAQHAAHLEMLTRVLDEARQTSVHRNGFIIALSDYVHYHVVHGDVGCLEYLREGS